MAYTPHEWECGETITAELLNNIEGGVQESLGNAPLILTKETQRIPCPDDSSKTALQYTYNHSWQEIYDALSRGRLVVYVDSDETYANMALIISAYIDTSVEPALYEAVIAVDEEGPFYFPDANGLVYIGPCRGSVTPGA